MPDKALFDKATEYVRKLPSDGPVTIDNATKLKFYGNFKQATVGPCSQHGGSQPWAVQVEARAKWDAWNELGDKTADAAMDDYVRLLDEAAKGWRDSN